MKPLLSALLLLALPAAVHAQFTFTTNNNTLTITRYSGPGGEVIIPDNTNGMRITGIGNSAFAGSGITAVTVPPSITNIDDYAFSSSFLLTNVTLPSTITAIRDGVFLGCFSLTNIYIPSSVKSIGNYAFDHCTGLNSFTIPSTVTNVGEGAFISCVSLSAIDVQEPNPFFQTLDGVLFSDDGAALIQYPAGKAGTYTIPNGVTSIWSAAFMGCAGLTNVILANTITSVGDYAFSTCTGLQSVNLPSGINFVGNEMFESCPSLTNVLLPQSLTSIGYAAFDSCTALKNISIPSAVTNIGDGAFQYCSSLADINLPSGLRYLGWNTFASCSSLSSITLPTGLKSIPYRTFAGCSSINGLIIPDSVTSIEQSAFEFCTSLSSIAIPSGVTNIADAFVGCSALLAITVDAANSEYSSLDGVLFTKDQNTLVGCPGSKAGSYTIPDTVTNIGYRAFSWCCGLTNIILPGTVASLQYGAFLYCTNLTGLYFEGDAPTLGAANVLGGDNKLTVYYLPGTRLWHSGFGGRPTALWFLPNPFILDNGIGFGPQADGFGFTISWATNIPVITEACSNLATHVWLPVRTNTLTNGACYFKDPDWTNHPTRFYRLRSP